MLIIIIESTHKRKGGSVHEERQNLNIDKTKAAQIEALATRKLKENNLYVPGFNLVKFLSETEGFAVGTQEMDADTTGVLLINENEFVSDTKFHKLIAINSRLMSEPYFDQWRRFIAAHEYGHSLLHKTGKQEIYAHRDTSNNNKPQEQEADFFARCLLMPKELFEKFLNSDAIKDFSDDVKLSLIARVFNVPPQQAVIRLKELTNNG